MSSNPVVPLLSDLAPDGFAYSGQYMVEFDADSLWYETSLTIAALALQQGIKTEYHVFDHFPTEAVRALSDLGVDAKRCEAEGLLSIWDSYTETTEFEKAKSTGIGWKTAGAKPLDIVQGAAAWVENTKKGFEPGEMRWLHLDDNTGIFLQYNDEETFVDRWRTAILPAVRARECPHFLAFPKGIASDAFYTKFEALCDGIIDVKTEEVEGRVERFLRIRRLKGKVFDSRWHRLEIQTSGAVRFADPLPSASSRRLAAIMFTDMVGSTALGQINETEALRLRDEQEQLVRPLVAAHEGREIKSMGDGFLVEFDSALRAVQCAISLQQRLHERNAQPGHTPLQVRVGIHLGDVESRGRDIFGDSVNVASRIQPLAEPGGICVTEPVFGQVRNKVPQRLEKLPPQVLKNVRFPFDVYRVTMPWEQNARASAALDPHRIAVMPLVNMISDPAEAYFADGMTEEIISAISKVRELDVISRTSVMQYKNTTKKAGEIGSDLNVGTLLEGSVRKAGNRVRIAVQLIDATSDKHVWAENYDRTLEDVFSIQSEIARSVAAMLKVALLENDRKRLDRVPTKDPEAHALYLKGMAAPTRQAASTWFQKAVDKDPQYALAYTKLADTFLQMGISETLPAKEASERGEALVVQALEIDPSLAEAHAVLAVALFTRADYPGVERELNLALELDPNHDITLNHKANWERFKRHFEESTRIVRRRLELDPLSLDVIQDVASQLVLLRRPDDALELFSKVLAIDPDQFRTREYLGMAYVQKGKFDEGIAILREAGGERKSWSLEGAETYLGYALGKAGRYDELRTLLAEALRWHEENHRGALSIAVLYASMGENERALEWLANAFEERAYMLPAAFSDFYFEPLWSDPRFEALRSRLVLG